MSGDPALVLLVEDDPQDARLLREAFQEVGADVRLLHAQEREEADKALEECAAIDELPALVVLDLHLGSDHGTDLLQAWRAKPALRDLPVAVLTSSSNERDIQKAKAADATSYYLKPKSLDEYFDLARDLTIFWLGSTPPGHA